MNENTIVTNRAGAPDPVIEDAKAHQALVDDGPTDADATATRHNRFRRRTHRSDR